MQKKNEVQQGWEFAVAIMGADVATHMGAEYVSAVEAAIKQLEDNINNHQYRNLGIGQLQGYMLEEWGAGTFNVDAVAADSADRASVLHSLIKDSVDIKLDSGEAFSAKSYGTPEQTAKAQARMNPDTGQQAIRIKEGSYPPIISKRRNRSHIARRLEMNPYEKMFQKHTAKPKQSLQTR